MTEPPIDDLLMGAAIQLDALVLARKRLRQEGVIGLTNPVQVRDDLDRIMKQLWLVRERAQALIATTENAPPVGEVIYGRFGSGPG